MSRETPADAVPLSLRDSLAAPAHNTLTWIAAELRGQGKPVQWPDGKYTDQPGAIRGAASSR